MRLALPRLLLTAAAVTTSLIEGVPDELPGVALGSSVLLHVERTAATFAIVVAIVSVLREARHGRLPTHLSTAGLAYESQPAPLEPTLRLQREVDELRAAVDRLIVTDKTSPEPDRRQPSG